MEPAAIATQLSIGHNAVHAALKDHELAMMRGRMGELLTPAEIAALEVHEWCYIYPELTEAALERLADSIAANGLDVPLVVWRRRWIIDGRHRFMACRNRGVPLGPTDFICIECDEAEAREKVDRLNLERRHLTQKEEEIQRSRRAMRAAREAMDADGRISREARAQAAAQADVSEGYIQQSAQLARESPGDAERVARGEKTIQDARRDAGLDRRNITRTEPASRTTLEQVKEECDERLAIRDQDSDEAWVKGLDLHKRLSGKNREMFVRDALAYRRLRRAQREWGAQVAEELKGNQKTPKWLAKQRRALSFGGPEHWDFCSSEDGGCDGEGKLAFGDGDMKCGNCDGDGYRLK